MTVGDLSTYLSTYETITATDGLPSFKLRSGDDILAAIAAADEPLVAVVEQPCPSAGRPNEACAHFNHGPIRIVAFTEDVLRQRLRDLEAIIDEWPEGVDMRNVLVRAIMGEPS